MVVIQVSRAPARGILFNRAPLFSQLRLAKWGEVHEQNTQVPRSEVSGIFRLFFQSSLILITVD